MYTRSNYDYIADTIINDPDIDHVFRTKMFLYLGSRFRRDFNNFKMSYWNKTWTDQFPNE